jgi:hypothetical protein
MRRSASILAVALGLLCCQTPALLAHHSNSAFQVDRIIELKGVVTALKWVNPHIWIDLTVDDGKGGKVQWQVEGRPPGILSRAGWTRNSVKPGSTVTIHCSPAKDGSHVALVARVTLADGTVLANAPPNNP